LKKFLAMYTIEINGKKFTLLPEDENTSKGKINDKPYDLDIQRVDDSNYHISNGSSSYDIELIKMEEGSDIELRINGRKYKLNAKNRLDLLLEELGMNSMKSRKITNLKAPMPGLVLDVHVTPGDAVKKGDPLLILEAMKMENVIKAAGDGVVKSIEINKGDAVEKNHLLINFE
jgi:biotin carboxyl carrier protein